MKQTRREFIKTNAIAATAAAADQGQPDRVVLRGMDMRNGHGRQGGARGDFAALAEELATGRSFR